MGKKEGLSSLVQKAWMDSRRFPRCCPRITKTSLLLVGLSVSSSSILLLLLLLARDDGIHHLRVTTIDWVLARPPVSSASDMALTGTNLSVDLGWYAPSSTYINDLANVVSNTTSGVYGFIYNSSTTPDDAYGAYNWCNMPHVRAKEYVVPSEEYELVYVELVCSSALPLVFGVK